MTAAATWLAGLLAEWPQVDAAAVRTAARGRDLEWRAVQRAATRLGVRRRRIGFGPGSRVVWTLRADTGVTATPTGDIDDAALLIERARAEGVIVFLTPDGGLRARGGVALDRWRPWLEQHAAAVISTLRAKLAPEDKA